MIIDWSKAPEGTTHYGPESDSYCAAWYRVENGAVAQYAEADSAMAELSPALCGSGFYHDIDDLIAPWTGDGLPPVGVGFEWRYGDHAWKTGEALYIGSVYVILKARDEEQHYYLRDMQFRPIRTPEQIAADERLHEIRNALTTIKAGDQQFPNDIVRGNIVAATVEAMIDAGYRKQVAP